MKPILPPNIISTTQDVQERVTILERNTRPAFQQSSQMVTVSAAGRASTLTPPEQPVSFVSSGLRPHTPFTIREIFVDVENPTDQFGFDINIDGTTVSSVTVPGSTDHVKIRVNQTILLPTVQTLTITSSSVKAEVGFVTIQLIGTSSTIINQTMVLRFTEAA
jgi:hypothetical protein